MNFLIEDTTKEERERLVRKALMISLSGSKVPSKEALILANEYIEGRMELEEIKRILISKYKKEDI